ncbi:hypothetical protein [Myroides sp. LoEW2-1]|uniref:hypothetical protein n=1 Tax=Myroides sp. LoEW2-1 TaxID=2683192 RepID=UPI0013274F64|nr:hypothetical protein [Myroides sp. LoEW2-1]MVX36899.1 hypothetical protein [Myroides sp. LoEW2-1]
MKSKFRQKTDFLFHQVVNSPLWDDKSETMIVVFGMVYYGYSLGLSTTQGMPIEDINTLAKRKLRTLNIQANYIEGMIDYAYQLIQSSENNIYTTLIEYGKSYANHYEIDLLVYGIFEYTEEIKLNR